MEVEQNPAVLRMGCWNYWVAGREDGPQASLVPSTEHLLAVSTVNAVIFWFSFSQSESSYAFLRLFQWYKPESSKWKPSEGEQKGLLQKHFPKMLI